MIDTADKKTTQAPHEVIARTLRAASGAGWDGRIISTIFCAETIILALHEAGYVIVPRAAVAAALERKEAAV